MDQINIFEYLLPAYKISKPARLIELFAGVGAQAMSLRDMGANFVSHIICEWEVNAFAVYKAIHMSDDHKDYSAALNRREIIDRLHQLGISNDGKKPMEYKEIARKSEKWQRTVYNNIRSTNNLVNIAKTTGDQLKITEKDKYTYILTYSFPCQDLSLAGKRKGMAKGSGTRSGMLWEVERLLTETEELPDVLVMENVPEVASKRNIAAFHEWQDFLTEKGYTNYVQTIDAAEQEVAQHRERTFMVSILGEYSYKFPRPVTLEKTIENYLEDEVEENYYINTQAARKLIENYEQREIPNTPPGGGKGNRSHRKRNRKTPKQYGL